MSTWLEPVRRALASSPGPITFFFRDDDAGWADEALYRLLDVMLDRQVPIALAAIPTAVSPALASALRTLLSRTPAVSVHQHGFAHANHEPAGRKCEFGISRSRECQRRDLATGKERLQQLFGCSLPTIFTPPWNRCTRDTADCLVELGFQLLSRDVSADGFDLPALCELPVVLDWSGRHGASTGPAQWGQAIARAIGGRQTIGFMLHHAVMTAKDHSMLSELLGVLCEGSNAELRSMLEAAGTQHSARGVPCES
jgi:predicted deacetylase